MTTHFIDGLAVEVDGEGAPIVCIHGLGGTSNTWSPLMRSMRNFKVIRIDLPGSGRSSVGSTSLSIERMVDSVLAVCKHFDITMAHFIGHSMGTIVCQHVATKKSSLVKSLTLFGPLVCPPDAARPNINARAQKASEGGIVAMQEIADAIVAGATSASTRESLPVAVAMVRESLMRQDPQGYSKSCEALAQAQSADLESISIPVLLVTGDEDTVAPPSSVREMARRLSNARVMILNRCGHWTTFERPLECAKQLEETLSRS
jgi:pimeloyl-ACP methyl ester carboxylesterase